MGKKEEITDLINDEAIKDKKRIFRGRLLTFQVEDTITSIKVTKVDRKNVRVWGEHIDLMEMQSFASHETHDVDMEKYWCNDCAVPLSEGATEEGNVAAYNRAKEQQSDS